MAINMSSATSYDSGQGIDVTSTVDALLDAQRGPETLLKKRQQVMTQQIAMLKSINSQLSTLGGAATALRDISGALSAQTATSSDAVVSASATANAASGTHYIQVTSLSSTALVYT